MATIIVSPTARVTARMNARRMPEKAAGTTTVSAVCMRVAPSAYAPSRRPLGTLCIASSASDETSGRIMMPITMPGLERVEAGQRRA